MDLSVSETRKKSSLTTKKAKSSTPRKMVNVIRLTIFQFRDDLSSMDLQELYFVNKSIED